MTRLNKDPVELDALQDLVELDALQDPLDSDDSYGWDNDITADVLTELSPHLRSPAAPSSTSSNSAGPTASTVPTGDSLATSSKGMAVESGRQRTTILCSRPSADTSRAQQPPHPINLAPLLYSPRAPPRFAGTYQALV
ncbi:hypothetical protein BU16DRAFT_581002 [Lophium mytilinum]|uniref:Uncharacterized protein n=1 Tax=Lophium mytilinum TaxID=390894 RepID=A0A6A6QX62_9PEZI|nr:hypothetical protein BU16DRAFT_581002 [Lophium mytilinum]